MCVQQTFSDFVFRISQFCVYFYFFWPKIGTLLISLLLKVNPNFKWLNLQRSAWNFCADWLYFSQSNALFSLQSEWKKTHIHLNMFLKIKFELFSWFVGVLFQYFHEYHSTLREYIVFYGGSLFVSEFLFACTLFLKKKKKKSNLFLLFSCHMCYIYVLFFSVPQYLKCYLNDQFAGF